MESKSETDRFVGIDVSKSWVDVHVRPDRSAFRCDTDSEGLAELVRRLNSAAPEQPRRRPSSSAAASSRGVLAAFSAIGPQPWASAAAQPINAGREWVTT